MRCVVRPIEFRAVARHTQQSGRCDLNPVFICCAGSSESSVRPAVRLPVPPTGRAAAGESRPALHNEQKKKRKKNHILFFCVPNQNQIDQNNVNQQLNLFCHPSVSALSSRSSRFCRLPAISRSAKSARSAIASYIAAQQPNIQQYIRQIRYMGTGYITQITQIAHHCSCH
jgi:hypothetical protein